jgi:hypothetical protein
LCDILKVTKMYLNLYKGFQLKNKSIKYNNIITKVGGLPLLSIFSILSACNPQDTFGDQNSLLQKEIIPKGTSTPISTVATIPTIAPTPHLHPTLLKSMTRFR